MGVKGKPAPPAWTDEEREKLRAEWHSQKTLAELAGLFTNRSEHSLEAQGNRMGLPARNIGSKPWTTREIAMLRELWVQSGSVKQMMDKLPGRTWRAILLQAMRSGLPRRDPALKTSHYSWIGEEVEKLLKTGRRLTVEQIAAELGTSLSATARQIKFGRGTKYYVSAWTRKTANQQYAAVYAYGDGDDVRRPARLTIKEQRENYLRRRTLKSASASPFAIAMSQLHREAA